jgi:L-threonylcarbamoyladenylate synthase
MPHIIKIDQQNPDKDTLDIISKLISKGKTFIYPTETFYGIGALYNDETSVVKIFDIKGRDLINPLPLIIPEISFLQKISADISTNALKLAAQFWPGPLTLVFKADDNLSHTITAGTGTVACRHSGLNVINIILKRINSSITSTSANISGRKNASNISKIDKKILDSVDFIIDAGNTNGGLPSTIIDVSREPFKILRKGAIDSSLLVDYCSCIT